MNRTKEQLLQILERLNDLMDSETSQEEAIWAVNKILYEMDVEIRPDINWLEQEMESNISLSKEKMDLLNTYKKTMRVIQQTKDHFDFPDPEAERISMFTDGLNNPDFEL